MSIDRKIEARPLFLFVYLEVQMIFLTGFMVYLMLLYIIDSFGQVVSFTSGMVIIFGYRGGFYF